MFDIEFYETFFLVLAALFLVGITIWLSIKSLKRQDEEERREKVKKMVDFMHFGGRKNG